MAPGRAGFVILDNFHQLVAATACLCIAVVFFFWRRQRLSGARLPPGPVALPIIGSLLYVVWNGFGDGLRKLARTYGNIFTLHLGPVTIVFLNKRELVRQAFSLSEFSGRPDWQPFWGDAQIANAGVADSTGDIWKTNRKLCLRYLSHLGLGKKQFEPEILDEIDYLLLAISAKNGGKFDIRESLSNAVSNNICRLIFGKRYEYTDGEFVALLQRVQESIDVSMLALLLPYSDKLPFLSGSVESFRHAVRRIDKFIDGHVKFHKEKDSKRDRQDDLIDAYLNGKHDESLKVYDRVVFEDKHIRRTILDFFVAGTETTTTTLYWMLVYLINFPDVQDKLRSEILRVVGTDRRPSVADRNELPLTQAFVSEVQRHATLLPLSVPHMTTKTVNIQGYEIPENTYVMSNIHEMHMNDEDFPCPEVFRPERFIDSEGRFQQGLADKVTPFGVGRRVCVGEPLAKMEIFLFLTSLLQHFEFNYPCSSSLPSLKGKLEAVYTPQSFELCAVSLK